MKYIPEKSYGYPVQRQALSSYAKENGDYVGGNFDPQFDQSQDPDNKNNLILETQIFGLEQPIKNAIGRTQANILIIVQCRNTFFTKTGVVEHKDASKSSAPSDEMIIDANELNGEITIRAIVVATGDFTLESENINPEFGYKRFRVKEGMLLAESPVSYCYVNKEPKNNPQSIITLTQLDTLKEGEFDVALDNQYIEVSVSKKLNEKITPMKNSSYGRLQAINILYVPVVTNALSKLINEPDDCENLKWAEVLSEALEDREKEGEQVRKEPHNQAQVLFRNAILTKQETEM